MEILIKRLNENVKLPVYGREAGPGIDIYSDKDVVIEPGAVQVLSTGVVIAMPVGYVGLISGPHSMVINDTKRVTPAVLDSGYREEIKIEITNTDAVPYTYTAGEKIAQLLVHQISRSNLIEAEDLDGV